MSLTLAEEFCQKLTELGCPIKTEASSLSWLFDLSPSLSQFLSALTRTLEAENVLSTAEVTFFTTGSKDGSRAKWLKGRQLEQAAAALKTRGNLPEQPGNLPELQGKSGARTGPQALEELSSARVKWAGRRDELASLAMDLERRAFEMSGDERRAAEAVKLAVEEAAAADGELEVQLRALARSVAEMVQLACLAGSGSPFLARLDLSAYHDQDKQFVRDLSEYVRKVFREGPSRDTVDDSELVATRFSLLDVLPAEELAVRGESKEAFVRSSRELRRLQGVLPVSLTQLYEAEISRAAAYAAAHTAEAQHERDSQYRSQGLSALRRRIDEASGRIAKVRDSLSALRAKVLPQVVKDLAALEAAPVLIGDYDLKLKRQHHHTAAQDRVLALLAEQRARHCVMLHQLAIDGEDRRRCEVLLAGTMGELTTLSGSLGRRVEALRERAKLANREAAPRRTVDERDEVLAPLTDLLVAGTGAEREAIPRVETLQRLADAVTERLARAEAELGLAGQQAASRRALLERNAKALHAHVFTDSATGAPLLAPPEVIGAQTALDEATGKLAAELEALMSDRATKMAQMERFPEESSIGRDLFVGFFTNPEKLREIILQTEKRVTAKAVAART
jgi:HAUS augmin-like complex subunit 3